MAETIRTLTSSDGRHRVDFHQAAPNLMRFTEFVWREEASDYTEGGVDRYWGVGRLSGLFGSLQEALAATQDELSWLRAEARDI